MIIKTIIILKFKVVHDTVNSLASMNCSFLIYHFVTLIFIPSHHCGHHENSLPLPILEKADILQDSVLKIASFFYSTYSFWLGYFSVQSVK
jgi:hypothetical protein